MGAAPDDIRWMRYAISLGARGLGSAAPNPAVGCVLVRDGRLVGIGWTQPGGRPHAEAVALEMAGAAAKGATAYVTLEPCAHHGKTPPCADALVAAGVARCVIACDDPDPRVAGQGVARLRAAGIDVLTGVCADQAEPGLEGHVLRILEGRPAVTLKLAASLDGRIATASGESRWITGPQARRIVHTERAAHDAVLVGAGTATADDPSLTARDVGAAHQPVRVVFDGALRLPPASVLGRTTRDIPVVIVYDPERSPADAARRWEDTGATLLRAASVDGHLVAPACLKALASHGLTRVFCEGGGALASALLATDCVDRLMVMHAGLAIGAGGVPALGDALAPGNLSDAPRFALEDLREAGGDVISLWRPQRQKRA